MKTHLHKVPQAAAYLLKHTLRSLCVVLIELQLFKEAHQLTYGHLHKIGNAATANLYIEGLALEAVAMTLGAKRLTHISRLKHSILHLMSLCINIVKEGIDTIEELRAMPQHIALGISQSVVWRMDGKVTLRGIQNHILLPATHRHTIPADHSTLINTLRLIGHNKVFIDTHDLTITLAQRACTNRIIEREEMLRRALEDDTIIIVARRVGLNPIANDKMHNARTITHSASHRIIDTRNNILLMADDDTVNNNHQLIEWHIGAHLRHELLNEHHLATVAHTIDTILHQCKDALNDALRLLE